MKNIQIISKSDYETRFPKSNNRFIESLDAISMNTYLSLYSMYSSLLENYLINKLSLKDYDDMIKDSGLNFIDIDFNEMDIYQRAYSNELSYIYLRNNIYIERLSIEEKEFLNDILYEVVKPTDSEIDNFIERTYKKVLFENINNNGDVLMTNFGPESGNFMVPNNALVLGIRYDEFNQANMDDSTWDKNNKEQIKFLLNIEDQLINNSNLDIQVYIIKYNEYSIINPATFEKSLH